MTPDRFWWICGFLDEVWIPLFSFTPERLLEAKGLLIYFLRADDEVLRHNGVAMYEDFKLVPPAGG